MSVNGITCCDPSCGPSCSPSCTTCEPTGKTTQKTTVETNSVSRSAAGSGVVYEPSTANPVDSTKKTYTQDTALVNKLKADAEARTAQLRSLVEKLMLGQGNAIGTADDMWSFLRSGNFTVDAQTKAQAQADIAEDGYWGVNQTSDRILDFAKALTGGDPSKAEDMREAFKKGFEQAKKTWGGELPEISQKTYEATMKKFDEWAAQVQDTSTVK